MSFLLRAPRLSSRSPIGADRALSASPLWQDLHARLNSDQSNTARPNNASSETQLASLEEDPGTQSLLDLVFRHSPFLTDCALRDPERLLYLFQVGPDTAFAAALAEARQVLAEGADRARLMQALRRARRNAALTIALADIAEAWSLDQVIEALSLLAESALDLALSFLLRQAAERGEIALPDPAQPLDGCGYAVLGMGKLGARELNYSSDIDLIVIYDPEAIDYRGRRDVADFCIRLTRELIALISERTAEGYVFRCDLRLRPDPGATPVAISYGAAMAYYESMGQNWERAAMIKARPVAGDRALGQSFLAELTPFVWRKSLDFLAIQDIHSIKRQIHAHKGGGTVAIEGHNVKLGRGGIREIEFFAQTQQLIWGGREPALRRARTKEALAALAAAGHTPERTAEELSASYDFLRRVEHRLQMRDDQQTHLLPAEARGIAALADFLGFDSEAAFRATLLEHFRRVEDHYAHLFEEAPSLAGPGNLVFTGAEPEPGTVASLTALSFSQPATVFNLVRSWHHGRYRATRSTRARELLTEIMPTLLQALGRTANPDAALTRFDGFLAGLPAGVQLFALLAANPRLLDLIAEVMGTAPALADQLSRRPGLLDAVLSPGFFEGLPPREALKRELAERLAVARDFQDQLDLVRRFANDHRFQAGIQVLQGLVGETQAGHFLSNVADTVLRALVPAVEAEFARSYGRIAGSKLAIIALGKLGSREMTPASDLDLVLLYDVPDGAQSDGAKSLDATTYFTRLAQRLINAVMVQTGEGPLYQIDMRLRPSGNAGPLATSLAGFRRYHERDAWTWEHMALTRARVVTGAPAFAAEVEAMIRAVLTAPRDPDKLLADVASMRERLARDKPAKGAWDVKLRPGGLVDCEFIAQYLQLRHAAQHPEVLTGATDSALAALAAAGLLPQAQARCLIAATRLWRAIQAYLRLTVPLDFDTSEVPAAIHGGLARATGQPDFPRLAKIMERTAAEVSALYAQLIGHPAAALSPSEQGDKT